MKKLLVICYITCLLLCGITWTPKSDCMSSQQKLTIKKNLCDAIQKGNAKEVKFFIKQDPSLLFGNIITLDDAKYSALGLAIQSNHENIVELLLKQNPKPDLEKVSIFSVGSTVSALGLAIIRKKSINIIKLLLEQEPKPNLDLIYTFKSGAKYSALHSAIGNNDIDLIKLLLEQDPQPNLSSVWTSKTGLNHSAFHEAIEKGNKEIIKLLIKHAKEKELQHLTQEELEQIALATNQNTMDFILWLQKDAQKKDLTQKQINDFASIAFTMPNLVELLSKKLLPLIQGSDYQDVFNRSLIYTAFEDKNYKALEALSLSIMNKLEKEDLMFFWGFTPQAYKKEGMTKDAQKIILLNLLKDIYATAKKQNAKQVGRVITDYIKTVGLNLEINTQELAKKLWVPKETFETAKETSKTMEKPTQEKEKPQEQRRKGDERSMEEVD
jgi:ankyrin repeat protein